MSWLNTQLDRACVDVNEFGWLCGWVMECQEKGFITEQQLGFRLEWVPLQYRSPFDGRTYDAADGAHVIRPAEPGKPVRIQQVVLLTDDAAIADSVFSTLMGEDVESRRTFIQQNAKDVRFLDI